MQSKRVLVLAVVLGAAFATGTDGTMVGREYAAAATSTAAPSPQRARGVPSILFVAPSRARPDQSVLVLGTNFGAKPKVVLAGTEIIPTRSTPVGLIFRVPPGLTTTSCESAESVSVKTDRGASAPASLVVRGRDPRLDRSDATLRTGRAVSLTGTRLAGARFTLGDVPLTVKASAETTATVIIPRDHPRGATTLSVSNDCGRHEIDVEVSTAPPDILGLDPVSSVAPTGILEITTDVVDPTLIESAELDDVELPANDPAQFRIVPRRDATANVVVAVRIPADTQPGWHELRLTGPDGSSDETPLQVVLPKHPVPPAPAHACQVATPPPSQANIAALSLFAAPAAFRILYPGVAGADDETIPLGSANNGGGLRLSCHHDPDAREEWFYDFAGLRHDAACGKSGTIEGFEAYCPKAKGCKVLKGNDRVPPWMCRPNPDLPDQRIPNIECFPLSGTYRVDSQTNEVKLTIDRGDGPEEYVGGWGIGDDMAPPAGRPAAPLVTLMLRSKRTGLQLSVAQRLAQRSCP